MGRKSTQAGDEAPKAPPRKRRGKRHDDPWRPPPLPWILRAGRNTESSLPDPSRILSAALPEAFLVAHNLKEVEVVAIDGDESRVRAARAAAARRRLRNLRIEHAPLDQPALTELVGGNFDAVLAHDVIHRCLDLPQVWRNLSAACAPHGSLYVCLRGPGHPSHHYERALGAFGLGPEDANNDEPLDDGKILALLGALGGFSSDTASPGLPASQVACSAADWLDQASDAGLHLRASTLPSRFLPRALAGGGTRLLTSFTLNRLVSFLDDYLQPASLEMVFSRQPASEPPWSDPAQLGRWIPAGRFLPLSSLEALGEPWDGLAAVDVEIHGVLEPQSFTLSRYMLELLRSSDGRTNLDQLMASIPHETSVGDIVGGLHFLHHTFIQELLPPHSN